MSRPVPRPLSELALAYAGRPAVVMGGGMSLPIQAARAPAGALMIGANEHASRIGIRCDYLVAVDEIEGKLRPWGVPIITQRRWGDYRIFRQPAINSGICAVWAAWVMGCAPILPAGMDFYVGGTYCHDPKAKSSGNCVSFDQHVHRWQKLKNLLPRAPIRSLGGPLLKLFPEYREEETGFVLPELDEVLKQTAGIVVDITKPIEFKPHKLNAGTRAELTESEARTAIRAKAGKIVNGVLCA